MTFFLGHKRELGAIWVEGRAQSVYRQRLHHSLQLRRIGGKDRIGHLLPIFFVLFLHFLYLFIRNAPSRLYLIESLDLAGRKMGKRLLLNLL